MANIKYSRQREAIKDFLISRKDHPTADVIYANVKKQYPNISLGTVYRNLSLLVKTGEAITVPSNDGAEHFDGCVEEHYHFQCKTCGAVLDLNILHAEALQDLNRIAGQDFEGEIEGSQVFFYGKCQKCKIKTIT